MPSYLSPYAPPQRHLSVYQPVLGERIVTARQVQFHARKKSFLTTEPAYYKMQPLGLSVPSRAQGAS